MNEHKKDEPGAPTSGRELSRQILKRFGARIMFMRRLYALGPRTIRACLPAINVKGAPPERRLALFMLNRASTALYSAIHLFSDGLDVDAMSVMRTITELLIDLAWILTADTPTRAERYLSYHVVIFKQMYESFRASPEGANAGPMFAALADEMKAIMAEYKAVMKKFSYSGYGWAPEGKSIAVRAKEGKVWSVYAMYALGSNASHSNASSVMQTVSGKTIRFGPRVPNGDFVLEMSSKSFLMLTERVINMFGVKRDLLNAFIKEHETTFSTPP